MKAIAALQQEFSDIECIAEPKGCKGIYPALNYAFNKYGHDYEYLTFINDDDYWLPAYKKLISEITCQNLDLVYGKVKYFNYSQCIFKKMASSSSFKDFIPLLHHNIILFTQQAAIFRSKFFYSLGGFDENYQLVADTKLWAQLSKNSIRYKYISKECAIYTIQEGQLSSNHNIGTVEHKKLLKEFPINKYKTIIPMLKYRIQNIHIYLKRYLKT